MKPRGNRYGFVFYDRFIAHYWHTLQRYVLHDCREEELQSNVLGTVRSGIWASGFACCGLFEETTLPDKLKLLTIPTF